jgi:hypothetical protein
MWRVFGHGQDAATATHHHAGYGAFEHVWHMLDQVVVRPEALDAFPEHEVRIVTAARGVPLVTAHGVPDARNASDHLPLFFRWNV